MKHLQNVYMAVHGNPSKPRTKIQPFVQRRLAIRRRKIEDGVYGGEPPADSPAEPDHDPELGLPPGGDPEPELGQAPAVEPAGEPERVPVVASAFAGPTVRWLVKPNKASAHATTDGEVALCGAKLGAEAQEATDDIKRCGNCAKKL